MSVRPVWISEDVKQKFLELQSLNGGHPPIIDVVDSDSKISSSFHVPTLFPQIAVPKDQDGNWAEVSFHISHLIRALNGIPELRSNGDEVDNAIAQSLNSEIEWLASVYDGGVPQFNHEGTMDDQIEKYIKTDHSNTLASQHIFWAFRLQNKARHNVPKSEEALILFTEYFPEAVDQASTIQALINQLDLSSLTGKVQASKILIDQLEFERDKFYFQETTYTNGVYNLRSLDYYENISEQEIHAFDSINESFIAISVQLPFHIPSFQGAYRLDENFIILKNKSITNARASWKGNGRANIESIMDSSGLYDNTELEILLIGEYEHVSEHPLQEKLYKNHKSYPKFIHDAVVLVNDLITYIRKENDRCDIPDVIPSHFNHVRFVQYDENKNILKKASTSFEYVKVSIGQPKVENDVLNSEVIVPKQLFHIQLLESAKLHLLQSNSRRAILDFCGAFEAFVSYYIENKIEQSKESLKDRFIRTYRGELNDEYIQLIEKLDNPNDSPRMLPLHKLVDNYRKEEIKPKIDRKKFKKILKIFNYRNDAAHGKPINNFEFSSLELAIDIFEEIEQCFVNYNA